VHDKVAPKTGRFPAGSSLRTPQADAKGIGQPGDVPKARIALTALDLSARAIARYTTAARRSLWPSPHYAHRRGRDRHTRVSVGARIPQGAAQAMKANSAMTKYGIRCVDELDAGHGGHQEL
jgi:hypothetical protein